MSKGVGDLLREMANGAKRWGAFGPRVGMTPDDCIRIAAVLDAADAMRDWTPVSYVPGLLPEPIEALRVEACATYDVARAALAEALKEGR